MNAADDLNAAHTANQWLEQDIRALCTLMGASKSREEWAVHVWRDSGPDVLQARAEWALKDL